MKNLLKKSAVATAVAGSLMISGMASADSLLAPLVIGVTNGAQTYFSIKVRGAGTANLGGTTGYNANSNLHYVWFQKGTTVDELYDLSKACTISNNNGKVSPWDMINQRAVDNDSGTVGSSSTVVAGHLNLDAADKSTPNGYTNGDFVGFVVITDVANVNKNPAVKDLANEGDMSGFGYVVDAGNSFVLDYKLLNNHRSKVEGDFSAGFIAKKSIDYSWMPVNIATTEWLTVVTGDDMLKPESGGGSYDATVYISQDTLSGSISPQLPAGVSGAYNSDETVTSGAKNFRVTCMGTYGRSTLLNPLQLADTVAGGWKRMSIQNSATRTVTNNGVPASVNTTQVASGAITYKAELINFSSPPVQAEILSTTNATSFASGVFGVNTETGDASTTINGLIERTVSDGTPFDVAAPSAINNYGVVSFQVETSGHLSTTPESHPNRPY
ncbi:hypothetical protein SAMN02745130_02460 [Thiothrix eikelboomii]|uniref:Uncharacterized protein n=1 Tax=Thiothrix eikelboomii TaxID=92487 RepID=A0A1T4X2W3_9GAMM|nr:hypothetical protein [Thiothrix eikelboomii]SKA83940.1 hypothetical protein SAMN02745130_02460 [Thiothrix eikelboomii]